MVLFLLKHDSIRELFFKFLEMRLFPQNMSVMDSYSGSNLKHSEKKKFRRRCPSSYRKKYLVWNIVMVFNLSKKDPATGHPLKNGAAFIFIDMSY